MKQKQEIEAIWEELEFRGERWMRSWGISCLAVPLEELRPYWNSLASRQHMPTERAELQAVKYENMLLKAELRKLKERLRRSLN